MQNFFVSFSPAPRPKPLKGILKQPKPNPEDENANTISRYPWPLNGMRKKPKVAAPAARATEQPQGGRNSFNSGYSATPQKASNHTHPGFDPNRPVFPAAPNAYNQPWPQPQALANPMYGPQHTYPTQPAAGGPTYPELFVRDPNVTRMYNMYVPPRSHQPAPSFPNPPQMYPSHPPPYATAYASPGQRTAPVPPREEAKQYTMAPVIPDFAPGNQTPARHRTRSVPHNAAPAPNISSRDYRKERSSRSASRGAHHQPTSYADVEDHPYSSSSRDVKGKGKARSGHSEKGKRRAEKQGHEEEEPMDQYPYSTQDIEGKGGLPEPAPFMAPTESIHSPVPWPRLMVETHQTVVHLIPPLEFEATFVTAKGRRTMISRYQINLAFDPEFDNPYRRFWDDDTDEFVHLPQAMLDRPVSEQRTIRRMILHFPSNVEGIEPDIIEVTNRKGIRGTELLHAMYLSGRKLITPRERELAHKVLSHREAQDTFEMRVSRVANQEEERAQGFRRIDVNHGRVIFGGLRHYKDDEWLLNDLDLETDMMMYLPQILC